MLFVKLYTNHWLDRERKGILIHLNLKVQTNQSGDFIPEAYNSDRESNYKLIKLRRVRSVCVLSKLIKFGSLIINSV